MGIMFLVAPISAKRFAEAMSKLPKVLLGLMPSLVGILFLWASPASSWSWFIAILGILGLLKGIFILVSSVGLVRTTINWWMNQAPSLYRFWGIIILILAGLVICSIVG